MTTTKTDLRRSARATIVAVAGSSVLLGGVLLATSCSSAEDGFIFIGGSEAGSGIFTPVDASDAADAALDPPMQCIGTTCPAGFETCTDGIGPAYKCGADLKRDPDHCGACGNKCLHYEGLHMTSRCIEGSCELECWNPFNPFAPATEWQNCNGKVDDGCEVDLRKSVKHCGACGNACGPDQPCVNGRCGCPAGEIFCDGFCTDPKADDSNCGGCGTVCDPAGGACSLSEPAYYGCVDGQCGHPKCKPPAADCNEDLGDPACKTDGCEVPDTATDPNNCGGCGIKCNTAAGEACVNEGNGPECAVPCARYGQTLCPFGKCRDLLNDPTACGACSRICPEAGPNQTQACRKGICALDCLPGFADCNGNPTDGCETNIMAHPGNCGACGVTCDIAGGQPCIEGKCLMADCDAGGIK